MNKEIILVERLVTSRVFQHPAAPVRLWKMSLPDHAPVAVDPNLAVQEETVPVIRLCGIGRDDVYVAYSQEVEETLGIPVRTILRDLNEARDEAMRNDAGRRQAVTEGKRVVRQLIKMRRGISNLSFRERLTFLFRNRLPDRIL